MSTYDFLEFIGSVIVGTYYITAWLITKAIPIVWRRIIETKRGVRIVHSLRHDLAHSMDEKVRESFVGARWLFMVPISWFACVAFMSLVDLIVPGSSTVKAPTTAIQFILLVMTTFVLFGTSALVAPRRRAVSVLVLAAIYGIFIKYVEYSYPPSSPPSYSPNFPFAFGAVLTGVIVAAVFGGFLDRRVPKSFSSKPA